jgi:hypothetical protein
MLWQIDGSFRDSKTTTKKLESTYRVVVKKSSGEDRGTEELWTYLFNALRKAYDSQSQNEDRVRIILLRFRCPNYPVRTPPNEFEQRNSDPRFKIPGLSIQSSFHQNNLSRINIYPLFIRITLASAEAIYGLCIHQWLNKRRLRDQA